MKKNDLPREFLLWAAAAFILGATLTAGLWPFHAPGNEVTWLSGRHGVRFGKYGIILGSRPFTIPEPSRDTCCSFEIWLTPEHTNGSQTILSLLHASDSRLFVLRQFYGGFGLEHQLAARHSERVLTRTYTQNLLQNGQAAFLAVTPEPSGIAIYLNGTLVRETDAFQIKPDDFRSQLILGDSAIAHNTFSGQLHGVALFATQLTPTQIQQHYWTWKLTGQPKIETADRNFALYLFEEKTGRLVPNHNPEQPDLVIPDRYRVVQQKFLEWPWSEAYWRWDYFTNLALNIAGFVPLGFIIHNRVSQYWGAAKALVPSVLLGACVSLFIEVAQAFLPTRNSGTTDLLTNTLGALLGASVSRILVSERARI